MIDRRDYIGGVPAEDLTRYCPGRYHPVHLGDSFNDGRYEILHKLGFGAFSTVWLARDLQYVQIHLCLRLLSVAICDLQQGALQRIPQGGRCRKIRGT